MRAYAIPILIAFCLATVFGLYLPTMSHAGHDTGCIFAQGGTLICAAPLAHLEHWQAAFTAVLVELVILFTLVLVFFMRYDLFDPDVISRNGIHSHPTLAIYVKGVQQEIPANIGVGSQYEGQPTYDSGMRMRAIHTHDDMPIVHLEFPRTVREDDLKLGNFSR